MFLEVDAVMRNLSEEVVVEVRSATKAHGPMKSRHEAFAVIFEELDEFWDEVKLNPRKMTELEEAAWRFRMKRELIQTAAMCVRAIHDLGLE